MKLSKSAKMVAVRVDKFIYQAKYGWSLVVVGRWSLFRGSFSTKVARAGFRVVVVDWWSLTQV
jgi:hypothetical protein